MKDKIQWIAWESCKLVILITCVVIMCANMFFLAKFNELDRGIDVIYDDIHSNQQEIRDIVQINKTPEK